MKDIHFTAKRQRVELRVFGICFLVAFALNIISIIVYKTAWIELFTQLGWVFMIGVFLYFLVLFFRLVYWLIQNRLLKKKK